MLLANYGDAPDVLHGEKGFDTCVVDRRMESGYGSGDRALVRAPCLSTPQVFPWGSQVFPWGRGVEASPLDSPKRSEEVF
jgi:hypothetical protein